MTTGTEQAQIITAEEAAPELYPLDAETTEVEIRIGKVRLYHRFNRPTYEQLRRRERKQMIWQQDVGGGETETTIETAEANRGLWNDIAQAVRNYDAAEWRPLDDALKAKIPEAHREKAIDALYTVETEFIAASYVDEDAGVYRTEGAAELHCLQTLNGRFKIDHFLRQPTQKELDRYQGHAFKLREERRAGQKTRARAQTDMSAGVQFYDALIMRIEGASWEGMTWGESAERDPAIRARFIAAYDPLLKANIASAVGNYLTPAFVGLTAGALAIFKSWIAGAPVEDANPDALTLAHRAIELDLLHEGGAVFPYPDALELARMDRPSMFGAGAKGSFKRSYEGSGTRSFARS